uniref:Uncharacterized protein n=1 Tax=Arundo donax TaxID=35708 RepID=A0A0A8XU45_ARUDO
MMIMFIQQLHQTASIMRHKSQLIPRSIRILCIISDSF